VQVKSRYATDCDGTFPVKEKSFDAFDFLVVVFLNIGNFLGRLGCEHGLGTPEFYTLPRSFIVRHHDKSSSWERFRTRGLNLAPYKNERGFELIAKALSISYPSRNC
jgi:hypothetical protein